MNAPAIKVFWAAQANRGDKGFLSKDITVRDMLTHHGDIHHIFPKNSSRIEGWPEAGTTRWPTSCLCGRK